MITIVLLLTAMLGLYMAWNIGANDVANSMAAGVGSKSCTIRQAIIAAGICEFAGAVLVGAHVTDTVRKGIIDPAALVQLSGSSEIQGAALLALGMISALLAAAIWLHLATFLGMPVSTTHSIVGAVTGFGIVAAGWSVVSWGKMSQIVASWFISPVLGGVLGYILFRLISTLILRKYKPVKAAVKYAPWFSFITFFVVVMAIVFKGLKHILATDALFWLDGRMAIVIAVASGLLAAFVSKTYLMRILKAGDNLPLPNQLKLVERSFRPLVFIASCTVAFAHGANDVANAVGPLAAVVDIFRSGSVQMKVAVPIWVLMLGGSGIVIGLAMFGYRVMGTVGTKITEITPSRGLAANIAAMSTVLLCSRMKLPVSTTHTLVGAILGVALARGLGAVNKNVVKGIFTSWIVTVPIAALMAAAIFLLARFFLMDYVVDLLQSVSSGG